MQKLRLKNKIRRHKRIRAKVAGSKQRPRLSVFRSNSHIYAQLINDQEGRTLASFNDAVLKKSGALKSAKAKSGKVDLARTLGKIFGGQILKKGCNEVVFDRGGYKYHGQIKALAEGLRESGIKF